MTLLLQSSTDKHYVMNLIDTPGHTNFSDEVTAEEMEAYHRIKKRDTTGDMADPMANFRDSIGAHFPS